MKTSFLLFLILITMLGWLHPAKAQQQSLTVREVMALIKQNVRPQWYPTKTDTIVIGDAGSRVTGIATCMFVDMNILQRAVSNHCNLIITHEPTFYEGRDQVPAFMKDDKILKEKEAYIKAHGITVFRFHDNGHRHQPDQIMQGIADELGWKVVSQSPWILEPGKQTLSSLAKGLKKHFSSPGIRVIGDPSLEISRVALVPGLAPTLQMHLGALQRDDVDAILVGEAREWEDYIYVKDAVVLGKKKAAIFIGHLESEQPGMKVCADWLKTFVKNVPVVFLKNDSYWWTPE